MHESDNNREEPKAPKRVNGKRVVWPEITNKIKILQIYSKGLEYAILSDNYELCHPLVWCKDFLHDIIHSTLTGKNFEIYRLKYNPNVNPKACLKEARILVANSRDNKMNKKIDSCLDFIHQIEDKLKITRTKVRKCLNPSLSYNHNNVFIFQGHKRWIFSPPMLSLYTLLIRVGFAHKIGFDYKTTIQYIKDGVIKPYQSKDSRWIAEVEPALDRIIRIGDKKIFYKDMRLNYPSSMIVDTMHNRMGIVGYAQDMVAKVTNNPVVMPYWHMLP
jgi:hypothetical protein